MPRKTSLNWFMPALANSSVGSLAGTSEELGTRRCPRAEKKSRNRCRISLPVTEVLQGRANFYSGTAGKSGRSWEGPALRSLRGSQIGRYQLRARNLDRCTDGVALFQQRFEWNIAPIDDAD